MARKRRDIHQEVTDRIIELLDHGTVPWRNPIQTAGGSFWPKNLQSGKQYRGINVFLLAMQQWESGYSSNWWLTFKQARSREGTVRKGEKSSMVIFWKQIEKEDPETGEEITLPVLKHYHVFNVEQCDGIEAPEALTSGSAQEPFEPLAAAEEIVRGYANGPVIEWGRGKAAYLPTEDRVVIPKPEVFEDRESYYCTLFHELSHSTGHSSRLDRGLDTKLAPFGSPDYSREELVAEMSAAFLSATAGISPPTIEQSAAYIDNWRRVLKSDKRVVVTAAGLAQKSADLILGEQFHNAACADAEDAAPNSIAVPIPPPNPSSTGQLHLF